MTSRPDRSDEHLQVTRRLWPGIEARSLIPVGDGWTCDTYEIDGKWIVQFPRNDYAAAALRKQCEALPHLGPLLPYPVPEPIQPSVGNAPAMLYRRISGVPFPGVPESEWPEQLGRQLGALQSITPAHVGLPGRSADEVRAGRAAMLQRFTEQVLHLLEPIERERIGAAFRRHIDDDSLWRIEPVLTHNDLGPEHILVDDHGRLAGVIDWEEISAGDPATDFAWLLHSVSRLGERVLRAAGIEVDNAFWERARFLYFQMPFHDVIYGLETKQQLFVELGLRGIRSRMEVL